MEEEKPVGRENWKTTRKPRKEVKLNKCKGMVYNEIETHLSQEQN